MNEQSIFLTALEIANPSDRADYVAHACGEDIKLLRDVNQLLAAHERSGEFLNLIGLNPPDQHDAPGEATQIVLVADEDSRFAEAEGTQVVGHDDDLSAYDQEIVLESSETPHNADDHADTWIKARGDALGEASRLGRDGSLPLGPTRGVDLSFLSPSSQPGSLGRLAHYEIHEVVGRGGCGVVLKALDEKLQRVVAIKVIAPELADYSPARKRFLREARAAASVRHDNVVAIYAVEDQPTPYLVTEFVAGRTLQQRLDQSGPLEPIELLDLTLQISRGLAAAHDRGLIHRDIKPANILQETDTGRVVITDFGLARTADDASLTQSGLIAGTPLYMSPEQAQGLAMDGRSDLFSMGSVLYALCTGRAPFRAPTTMAVLKRVTDDAPRPIVQLIPDAPEWLTAIITRLHAKNPDERFKSARDVAEAAGRLQAMLVRSGSIDVIDPSVQRMLTPPPVAPAPRPSRRLRSPVVGALAALLLGSTFYALSAQGWLSAGRIRSAIAGYLADDAPSRQTLPAAALAPVADPDRRGAEYIVSIGGAVEIVVDGRKDRVSTAGRIPTRPFTVTGIEIYDKPASDEGLSAFAGCKGVTQLYLAYAPLTAAALAPFSECAELKEVSFIGMRNEAGVAAELATHKRLDLVCLWSLPGGDDDFVPLGACPITDLNIGETRAGDRTLSAFARAKSLTRLNANYSAVTDVGMAALEGCDLTVLCLDRTAVTDAGMAHVAHCQRMELLSVDGTNVTDAGVAPFKTCKSLRQFIATGSQVSPAMIAEFRAALPACKITYDQSVASGPLRRADERASEAPGGGAADNDNVVVGGDEPSSTGSAP